MTSAWYTPSRSRRGESFGTSKKSRKVCLEGLLERVLGARVVLAIVVVVPGGEDPRGFLQRLIAGLRPELGVGGAQLHRVGGIRVHIVAQEHESVGFQGQHVLPDWLHPVLAQAGAESDAAHGRFVGRGHSGHENESQEGKTR